MPPAKKSNLTVAVTGPTGTFGFGLVPLLQDDDRIARIVGIARRPFDPAEHGWTKMEYRQGDVRDPDALEDAFRDADVVVHLAFMITGTADRETISAINIDGTQNTFQAAAAADAIAGLPKVPGLPPATEWVEAASHPALMDTTKAKTELGWKPRYDAVEALR